MADCWTCLSRIQVALVLALVQLIFSFYAIVTQWALHHSDDGSAGGDEAKPMNPAVYNVLRDVGCSIVLIIAGRVKSGEFMWPESNDRFIFVLIGVCNVYFGQYFNVLGVTYANALTSSIWQNTIPVFTLIIGLLSGIERIAMRAPPSRPRPAGTRRCCLSAAAPLCTRCRCARAGEGLWHRDLHRGRGDRELHERQGRRGHVQSHPRQRIAPCCPARNELAQLT